MLDKIKKIKIVLNDVDGILTDGGMYYTETGLVMKRFHVHDGMGAVLLRKAGIKIGMITTDNSPIVKARAEKLGYDYLYIGLWDKPQALTEICRKEECGYENVAFIGDDINDIEILKLVGLSAAPANAVDEVKSIVNYVCTRNGGDGAYRELADLIIKNRNAS